MKDGYIKTAAASPMIRVADTDYNAEQVIKCIESAKEQGVKLLVFPALTLTGACCYDLFRHKVLLEGAKRALGQVIRATAGTDMLVFVGLPFAVASRVFSCAAAIYDGDILALVPQKNVQGTGFDEPDETVTEVSFDGYECCLGTSCLFRHEKLDQLIVAAEVGSDITAPVPPSVGHALAGASVIAQLADFPETVFSTENAELAIRYQSKNVRAGIVLAAPGKGESTTDHVFSGLCMVAENGVILSECEEENSLAVSELDVDLLTNLRRAAGGYDRDAEDHWMFAWGGELTETVLTRKFNMYPHLPENKADWPKYCRRMLDIQVSGLVKRMKYAHLDHCVVGISGGVDSTLAVIVSSMAVKKMGLPSTNVVACTLPCFGTSSRTKSNAIVVAEQLGCEVRIIDIGKSVYQHFDDIGHAHDDYSVAYENAQARERTQILMDIANKVNGLDVGTEDLSEFIDGWCTYNGDHTSMYDVNMGMTKTQVRTNVRYIAETTENAVLAAALWDVLDCPVTPELLPILNDEIIQKSEDSVGSYSLQDFFTHKMLICGFTPSKTFRLSRIAYRKEFTDEELLKWLNSYCRRLFSQQFKRSCLMDGPCVEDFSVSPRVGFLIPSDAECALFLKDLESIKLG